jgi:hypothetical protein
MEAVDDSPPLCLYHRISLTAALAMRATAYPWTRQELGCEPRFSL